MTIISFGSRPDFNEMIIAKFEYTTQLWHVQIFTVIFLPGIKLQWNLFSAELKATQSTFKQKLISAMGQEIHYTDGFYPLAFQSEGVLSLPVSVRLSICP